ncbi:flavin monoamine oxidase family protein [Halomicroarcula sp. GCM10025710]
MTTRGNQDRGAVIVGAGLAGLTAARELMRDDHNVTVLEARDRVGGRTLDYKLADGERIDLGGQWIGPTQDHVQELIEEFGLETVRQYDDGNGQLAVEGTVREHDETLQALPAESLSELMDAFGQIDTFRNQIPLDAPYSAPKAKEWDATTVESWKDETLETEAARAAFDTVVRALFTAEPADISFLYFLFYIHAAGGVEPITAWKGVHRNAASWMAPSNSPNCWPTNWARPFISKPLSEPSPRTTPVWPSTLIPGRTLNRT